jgi:hypothetical protein
MCATGSISPQAFFWAGDSFSQQVGDGKFIV